MSHTGDFQQARVRSRDATIAAAVESSGVIRADCHELGLYPIKLLKALASVESSLGTHLSAMTWIVATRQEPAYSPDGRYYERSAVVKRGWEKWGTAAGSSHGPYQVMWVVAVEHGYPEDRDPLDNARGLGVPRENARVAARVVQGILSDIIQFRRVGSQRWRDRPALDLVGDAYNSGSFRDRIQPREYIAKLGAAYKILTDTGEYP